MKATMHLVILILMAVGLLLILQFKQSSLTILQWRYHSDFFLSCIATPFAGYTILAVDVITQIVIITLENQFRLQLKLLLMQNWMSVILLLARPSFIGLVQITILFVIATLNAAMNHVI